MAADAYLGSLTEVRLKGICTLTANVKDDDTGTAISELNTKLITACGDAKRSEFLSNLADSKSLCDSDRQILEDKINSIDSELDKLTPTNDSCRFKDDIEEGYSCVGNNINITATTNQNIEWTGNHTNDRDNSDIAAFIIKSQTVKFMPLNVGNFFPNVTTFIIFNSTLSVLKNGDFTLLENLNSIFLNKNAIASIESGTFSKLLKLNEL